MAYNANSHKMISSKQYQRMMVWLFQAKGKLWVDLWPLPDGRILFHRFLPVLAIKSGDRDIANSARIKTMDGNSLAIRVGTRRIEALDSAHTTESVLCPMCVERVACKHILTLHVSTRSYRNSRNFSVTYFRSFNFHCNLLFALSKGNKYSL